MAPAKGGQWSPECLDFLHKVINSDRDVDIDNSPVKVIVVDNYKMPLKDNIQIKKGEWIDVSQLLVTRGEAVLVESGKCWAIETNFP